MNNDNSNSPLKISYISDYDASDVHNWSGLGYFISEALKLHNTDIDFIGNINYSNPFSIIRKIYHKGLLNKIYMGERELFVAKSYAKQIAQRINPLTDIIFSPGSIALSMLKSEKKKVFYTDATFGSMVNYYFKNLCKHTINEGNKLEKMALENCDLAIYASEWAAQSAIQDYQIDPQKVKVVPFGANIKSTRQENDIKNIINAKNQDKCYLLFLGVDWERKGGETALRVAEVLHSKGIPVQLDIAGIRDKDLSQYPFVQNHGFISKSTPEGLKKLEDLMAKAHFLLLPTKAECFGIVFSEASSFGLPSIATKTGGVTTAVNDHINGMTFDLSASPEEYAEYIYQLFNNYTDYEKLALSSFHDYENRLNWSVSGKKIVELMKELLH